MTYVEGFITPVPHANKNAYRQSAEKAAPLFREFGATRHVEAWADDVPDGKVTDFKRSVQAQGDETVAIGWLEYPDRATRDAAVGKMQEDPRMKDMDMPFDGKRMIFGGFDSFLDERGGGSAAPSPSPGSGYVDGFVLAVPDSNRQAYHDMAAKAAANFKKYGAVRVVEAWGDDVPEGKVTDFRRAVQAEAGESVIFSWIEWPDKETRDSAWKAMMEDPEMQPDHANMPFDGKRMFWGGFAPVLDTGAQAPARAERELA